MMQSRIIPATLSPDFRHMAAKITGDFPDCSREEIAAAWQMLIDTGTVWGMGQWWSDMACSLIASGVVERNPT